MSGDRSIEIRPATDADLEAEHRVFVTAEGELWARHDFEWPAPTFEAWAPVHRHLLNEDGDRSFVAVEGEQVVGFTAALARDDVWYFSALFVLPEYQGSGVGRELLDRAWAGPFGRRITITDSFQPMSNGLYASRGLIPTTPILSLAGRPTCGPADDLESSPPDADAIAAIDQAAYGFDRTPDHRFWHAQKGAPTLWTQAGTAVGYSYTAPNGLIGPLAALDAPAAARVLRADLGRRAGEQTALFIPGTARTLVAAALDAGLRFSRPPGLLLLSDGCPAPTALAISGYWLL